MQPAHPPSFAASDGAGWLGITMSEVSAEKAREVNLADVHGALVTGITANSPAARAGLGGGDIVTVFRGQRVEGTLELGRLVRETPPGRTVKLSVWRDGGSREFSVEIGRASALLSGNFLPPDFQDRLRQFQDRLQRRFEGTPEPDERRRGAPGPLLGIAVQSITGQFGAYLKVPEGQGALISDVQAGSAAERAGLRAGDVIVAVDGQRVHNVTELRAHLRDMNQARTLALRVIRNGGEMTVNVEVVPASGPAAQPNNRPAVPI